MKGGVEIAVNEINNSGGINGKPIEVIYEDGQCIEKASAVSAAQKLINVDTVQVVLGGGCSGEVLSTSNLFNENNVVMFSSGASSPEVSRAGEYIYRNIFSDIDSGISLAEKILGDGKNNIAIISDKGDFSLGLRNSFVEEFKNNGGNVVYDLSINTQDNYDYRSSLAQIDLTKIDSIFINTSYAQAVGLISNQLNQLGIVTKYYFAFHTSPDALNAARGTLEGAIVIDYPKTSSSSENILQEYVEINNKETVYKFNTIAAYDATKIIANAISEVGYSGKKIKQYLDNLEEYQGLLGRYSFDENGDFSGLEYSYSIVKNNSFVGIE